MEKAGDRILRLYTDSREGENGEQSGLRGSRLLSRGQTRGVSNHALLIKERREAPTGLCQGGPAPSSECQEGLHWTKKCPHSPVCLGEQTAQCWGTTCSSSPHLHHICS